MRQRWATIFGAVPDLQAKILRTTVDGETVWAEWRWQGTRPDGSAMDMRGVTMLGVRNDQFAWGRLYMEQMSVGGPTISQSVSGAR